LDRGYANFVEIVIAEVQLRRIPLLKLSDKSLDGPQGFVLMVLKAAKTVFVGPF
jgi:hypothetical protein